MACVSPHLSEESFLPKHLSSSVHCPDSSYVCATPHVFTIHLCPLDRMRHAAYGSPHASALIRHAPSQSHACVAYNVLAISRALSCLDPRALPKRLHLQPSGVVQWLTSLKLVFRPH
ncbi:hypothetical protein TorRG33x02_261430 [Trema orientale]|uniref:Uncharacterized protein n=1 Tax=Trema orientale TaxID=63057 RepID=A0A2P5D5T2_TREOI|nr:hypothetical protein TorRG33x02_261430 [Trema orientale]